MPIFSKPPIRPTGDKKKDMPQGLWHKCPSCGEVVHDLEMSKNLRVCPRCDHHALFPSADRIESVADPGSFRETDAGLRPVNPLAFQGYDEKMQQYQDATGLSEAIVTGTAAVGGHPVSLGVMDFRFLGASMGSVVGEKITRSIERATAERRAAILFSSSGGARMHEGILSLMQMAKTSGALARHSKECLPYLSVLTHPTTGGVTASFATLGDIILAEPKCMIGFAGPRVVRETTHQDLPPGFQTAEFMMEHGLIDRIVHRKDLRECLRRLLDYMMPARA